MTGDTTNEHDTSTNTISTNTIGVQFRSTKGIHASVPAITRQRTFSSTNSFESSSFCVGYPSAERLAYYLAT